MNKFNMCLGERERTGVYQAAPRTETPMATAMPMAEKVYGDILTSARDHELDSPNITEPDIFFNFFFFFFLDFFLWWVLIWFDNTKSARERAREREVPHVLSATRDLFGGFWTIRSYWNDAVLNMLLKFEYYWWM